MTKPLNRLTEKEHSSEWTSEHQEAFIALHPLSHLNTDVVVKIIFWILRVIITLEERKRIHTRTNKSYSERPVSEQSFHRQNYKYTFKTNKRKWSVVDHELEVCSYM